MMKATIIINLEEKEDSMDITYERTGSRMSLPGYVMALEYTKLRMMLESEKEKNDLDTT